eukprot:831081-Rhodomonas_salina.4
MKERQLRLQECSEVDRASERENERGSQQRHSAWEKELALSFFCVHVEEKYRELRCLSVCAHTERSVAHGAGPALP